MRFYGWTWQATLKVPLRVLWTCIKNMHRIRAAEELRAGYVACFPNMDENGKRSFQQDRIAAVGVTEVSDERDEDGLNKLKALS